MGPKIFETRGSAADRRRKTIGAGDGLQKASKSIKKVLKYIMNHQYSCLCRIGHWRTFQFQMLSKPLPSCRHESLHQRVYMATRKEIHKDGGAKCMTAFQSCATLCFSACYLSFSIPNGRLNSTDCRFFEHTHM